MRFWHAMVGGLVAVAMSSGARAEELWPAVGGGVLAPGQTGAKDSALVIGVEDYAFVDDIPGAADAARDWQQWLTGTRGVPVERTVLMVDAQAVREDLLAEAAELAKKTPAGGVFWVVYIGHGAPSKDGKDGVLVGADAQKTARSLYGRSVTRAELWGAIASGRRGGGETVAIIDACFSGKSDTDKSLAPDLMPVLIADDVQTAKVTMLTAGRSDEFAGPLPELGRPAFSYLVLGAMSGWQQSDRDGDGQVSLGEALQYSQGAITSVVRGRKQTPTGDGAMLGVKLVMVGGAGPDLRTIQRRLSQADNVTRSGFGVGLGVTSEIRKVEAVDMALPSTSLVREDFELLEKLQEVKRADKSESIDEIAKAQRWDEFAAFRGGSHPLASQAKARAAAWRERAKAIAAYEAQLGQVEKQYVADKAKLERLLKLDDDVVSKEQKATYQREFDEAYGPWMQGLREMKEKAAERAAEAETMNKMHKLGYVRIEAGSFMMGSPANEEDRGSDEAQHEVRITRPFWLKSTEVTQGEWRAVMGTNPSSFSKCGGACPVEQVSWDDAVSYLNKLSEREGLSACYESDGSFRGLGCTGYRLPTEAEWEYAARAGTVGARYGSLDSVAWHDGNSGSKTQPVGRKSPNAWGLYDMLGNVWEWVDDWWGDYEGNATDPVGPSIGKNRVLRGGSSLYDRKYARAAYRFRLSPGLRYDALGFRPAKSIL